VVRSAAACGDSARGGGGGEEGGQRARHFGCMRQEKAREAGFGVEAKGGTTGVACEVGAGCAEVGEDHC